MYEMFFNCSSICSVPDVLQWSVNSISDERGKFGECFSVVDKIFVDK